MSNNNRPDFDDIKNYEEFSKYYWYRDELIKICRDHGLKSPSGKIELNKIIEAYFAGERILPEKKPGKKKKSVVTGLYIICVYRHRKVLHIRSLLRFSRIGH